ncbi:MAG: iron-containing redox enzyme family protein [Actinophytocola sp.]|uniref:iron-containing redox enzyme family protein n=1 Tax=Actinophytocola sp. TaxID=1872138 RepID=UPI00132B15B8|nr:iron-containing redox enzyme family protein [Actinophytocola sp.]MPZ81609.1 iron-containing redox enzyme family protein [Actinophytocola sp.]
MTQMDVKIEAGTTDLAGLVRSYAADPSGDALRELGRRADEVSVGAFGDGDPAAELEAQRFLYEVYAHRILPPWSPHWRNYTHPAIVDAHRRVGDAWLSRDRAGYGAGLEIPTTPEAFGRWATEVCQTHASGVTHPLFDFLAERATFAQLRDFLGQETPFDIHFGDLVALLLPGIHGGQKIELAGNFWDEMGNGQLAGTHRQLRLDMMERVGIPAEDYLSNVDGYWLEELRMANMYFQTSSDRSLAPQSIGMLQATELVVPGRLERQIEGWRRVGLTEGDMHYLLEHVTVDVEHAEGWLNHVIAPLAATRPDLLPEVAIGILRRLDCALAVCDRAMHDIA